MYSVDYFFAKSSLHIDTSFFKTKPLFEYRSQPSVFIDNLLNRNTVRGLKHSIAIFLIAYLLQKS